MSDNGFIFDIKDPSIVQLLQPRNFRDKGMTITQSAFEHLLKVLGAYWRRRNDPTAPHVKLSSGKHSNLYLNLAIPLTYPNLRNILAWAMIHFVRQHFTERIDWIVSSDHAGAAIMYAMSDLLGARADFCEKAEKVDPASGQRVKQQLWQRHQIAEGERVLVVEELTTTAGTIEQVLAGLVEGNQANFRLVPLIPVIVNRTGKEAVQVGSAQMKGLFTYPDARAWDESDCELCRAGSPLVDKPRLHWPELMEHCA